MVKRFSTLNPFHLRLLALALAVSLAPNTFHLLWNLVHMGGNVAGGAGLPTGGDLIGSAMLHSFFESRCVILGGLTLGVAYAVYRADKSSSSLILAGGLFWSGVIHIYPALAPLKATIPMTAFKTVFVAGALSRFLGTVLLSLSAVLSMEGRQADDHSAFRRRLKHAVVGGFAMFSLVFLYLTDHAMSESPDAAAFARGVEITNLAWLATIAPIIWLRYLGRENPRFIFALFLGWMPSLVGQLNMVFLSITAFDSYFFIADGLTFLACLCPFIGYCWEALDFYQNFRDKIARQHKSMLQSLLDKTAALEAQIAEKQAVEVEMRETAQRFNQLVDNLSQAFWISDAHRTEIIYISPGYEKIWKRSSKELHQNPRSFFQAIHPDDHDRVLFAQSKLAIGLFDEEYRIILPDGTVRWVRDRAFPVEHASGEVERVVGIAEDVTYQKEAEQIISEQRLQMLSSSKMSSLGEMAGGIAHEINNPLAIIHTRAGQLKELAEMDQINPEMVRVTAEKIEQTVMRISKIVRGLRSFARDGDADPYQASSIRAIIYDTFEFCREKFKYHLVEASIGEIPEELLIECRATQISQLLLNLVSNAYDAIATEPSKWIKVEVVDQGEWVKILITDSGRGIPATVAERIFQPFYTTKEIGKGTGLGLSICKGIVDAHQGELSLDRACPNTRFVIQLPKTQGQPFVAEKVA